MIKSTIAKLKALRDVDPAGLADGDSPVWNASAGKFEFEVAGGDGAPSVSNLFSLYMGDGSDGAVTVANGVTVTLTHDMSYTTLVVQSGGIVETAGWRVYATLSVNVQAGGIVRVTAPAPSSPGSAVASISGVTGYGAGRSTRSFNTGVVGLAAAGPGSQTIYQPCFGGGGGGGGGIGAGAGGIGPAVANEESAFSTTLSGGLRPSAIRALPWKRLELALDLFHAGQASFWGGGAGGGAGAGVDASNRGGAGGTGGGTLFIAAPSITINGTVRADGSVGAASASGSNGGGGGGGGGGLIITNSTSAVVGTPTYSAAGGSGGSGVGTGNSGSTGATGTTINNVWS